MSSSVGHGPSMPRTCKPAANGGNPPRGRHGGLGVGISPLQDDRTRGERRNREARSCRTDHRRGGGRDRCIARRRRRVGGDHEERPECRNVRRSERSRAAGRCERRPAGGRPVDAGRGPARAGSDGQPRQLPRAVRPSRPPRRPPSGGQSEAPAELRRPELLRAAVRQRRKPVLRRAARSGSLRRRRQGRRDREQRLPGVRQPRSRAHESDRHQLAVRLSGRDQPQHRRVRARRLRSDVSLRQPDEDVLRRRQRARSRRYDVGSLGHVARRHRRREGSDELVHLLPDRHDQRLAVVHPRRHDPGAVLPGLPAHRSRPQRLLRHDERIRLLRAELRRREHLRAAEVPARLGRVVRPRHDRQHERPEAGRA